jgi:hypothetical protein
MMSNLPAWTDMSAPVLYFRRTRAGAYEAGVGRPPAGPVRVEVGLRLPAAYLAPYCRYARVRDPSRPPTFLNTEYALEPPGQKVGPWPGWRGIPELPEAILHSGEQRHRGQYFFLGDEEEAGELRLLFTCEDGLGARVRLQVADPVLVPRRARILTAPPSRAEPRPVAMRPELHGVHPRLVLDEAGVARLRGELPGAKAGPWRRLRRVLRESWDLPYATTPEGKVLPGPERLTGADRVLLSALVALLRPRPAERTRAKRAYFAYLRETARPDFGPLGIDTQSGEVLYILCVGYDWLHAHLTSVERRRARGHLDRVAAVARRHLDPARRDYAQAHYLGCGLGLLAYALLWWEERPEARVWAAELRGAFDKVLRMLPADGFFPHGLNLWIYEHGFLLRWLELFRQGTGENLWRTTPYWRAASGFRGAVTSPDGGHGVTFGDPQYRVTGDSWCHFLIAARTGSRAAWTLGERLLAGPPAGTDHRHAPPRRRVYELLWREANAPGVGRAATVDHFADGGQVAVRRRDTLITLRAGAPLGRQRRAAGEWGGYGHSDPCHGAILVWRGGTFVGSGPGPLYRRDTHLHNLLTVAGRGQVGDGGVWFPDYLAETFIPAGPEVKRAGREIVLHVELARAYLPHLGVQRHSRVVRIAPDGSLRGVDEVELSQEAEVAWHWHTWAKVRPGAAGWRLTGPGCRAHLGVERVAGDRVEVAPESFVAAYPHEGTVGTAIRVVRRARRATFRWSLQFD